jgi:large repetitive protein
MKKRSLFARRCSFESLEERRLMAGDVFARIERGNLIVRGDDGNNGVFVRAGFAPGEIIVLGTDVFGEGTRVNGLENTAVTLSGFNGRIEFTMNGGADRIRIQDLPTSRGITADLGRGSEGRFELIGHTANGDISVKSREGNDQATFDNVTVNGSLTVDMGDGGNTLVSTGGSVGRDAKFLGGRGIDEFSLNSIHVVGTFFTSLGDGQNTFFGHNTSANRVELKGGRNNDFVQFEPFQGNWMTIDLGHGDNTLNLFAPRIFRDLRIIGGSGIDNVRADESLVDGNAYVDLGDGNNSLLFQLGVTGQIVVRGGRGMDDFELDGLISQTPVAGLKVELGDGTNSLEVKNYERVGKTELKGGKDGDTISVTDAVFESLFAELGGGTNEINFDAITAARDFIVKGGSGGDTGYIRYSTIRGKTLVDLGDGNNEYDMGLSEFRGDVEFKSGKGADRFSTSQMHIFKSFKVDVGSGANRVIVYGTTVDGKSEFKSGEHADDFQFTFSTFAALDVALGKGDDKFLIAAFTSTQRAKIDGGDGRDAWWYTDEFPNNFAGLERKSFESFISFIFG